MIVHSCVVEIIPSNTSLLFIRIIPNKLRTNGKWFSGVENAIWSEKGNKGAQFIDFAVAVVVISFHLNYSINKRHQFNTIFTFDSIFNAFSIAFQYFPLQKHAVAEEVLFSFLTYLAFSMKSYFFLHTHKTRIHDACCILNAKCIEFRFCASNFITVFMLWYSSSILYALPSLYYCFFLPLVLVGGCNGHVIRNHRTYISIWSDTGIKQ